MSSGPGPMALAELLILDLAPGVALLLAATAYAMGMVRLLHRGDSWPVARAAAALFGLACLTATLLPPLADSMTFAAHAVRHLLLAMVAPLALALSAPITLALRTFPRPARRGLLVLLHSRIAHVLTAAPVVLALDLGGING